MCVELLASYLNSSSACTVEMVYDRVYGMQACFDNDLSKTLTYAFQLCRIAAPANVVIACIL